MLLVCFTHAYTHQIKFNIILFKNNFIFTIVEKKTVTIYKRNEKYTDFKYVLAVLKTIGKQDKFILLIIYFKIIICDHHNNGIFIYQELSIGQSK